MGSEWKAGGVHARAWECSRWRERRMIDWREGMQSAINSPLGSKRVTRTTESELLLFWISGASSIFLWLPVRSPALERLPRWCGAGVRAITLTVQNKIFKVRQFSTVLCHFCLRLWWGKVEHSFIEKLIVIGALHDLWQRTLKTSSPDMLMSLLPPTPLPTSPN